MSDWPIGLSTGCFHDKDILDVLETIRNGGFTLLEVCSSRSHLDYHDIDKVKVASARLKELGMDPVSFHAPFANHIDITHPDSEHREVAISELLKACTAAASLGVRHFVIHPGPEMDNHPPEEEKFRRMKNGASSLNRVAAYCRETGLQLQLENMLPHLLFGNTSDMLYMFGAIEGTDVGACLDTGHANLSGDITTVIHKLSGHLQMIHANDNHGDFDSHLPPGHGNIDWRSIIYELVQYQFNGTIILELSGGGSETDSDILGKACDARSYLQEVARDIQMKI